MNRDTLLFVEEATRFFNESENHHTYRDSEEEYIALRYGLDRDCIKVYKLDEELEFFEQWCDKVESPRKSKYEILDNSSVPYEIFEIVTSDNTYEEERYIKKICIQMNGIDRAIKSRNDDLIYMHINSNNDDLLAGESMSISQAKDVVEALNACIHHAEKVKAD